MISHKALVARICVFYLDSMIVNDLLKRLGIPNMCLIRIICSSMISFVASVAQNVSNLDFIIVNDLLHYFGRKNLFLTLPLFQYRH